MVAVLEELLESGGSGRSGWPVRELNPVSDLSLSISFSLSASTMRLIHDEGSPSRHSVWSLGLRGDIAHLDDLQIGHDPSDRGGPPVDEQEEDEPRNKSRGRC